MILGNRTPIFLSVLAFSVLLSFSTITETIAQSRVCRNLQSQLSALPRGGGGSNSAAIKSQLSQAQRQANQKRCGALFGQRSQECAAINAKIKSLTSQLRGGGGGGSAQKRQQIMAALKANGCGKSAAKSKAAPKSKAAAPKPNQQQQQVQKQKQQPQPQKKKVAAKPQAPAKQKATAKPQAPAKKQATAKPQAPAKQSAPDKQQAVAKPQEPVKQSASDKQQAALHPQTNARVEAPSNVRARIGFTPRTTSRTRSWKKTYRTMCVRLCDGYYFPISFSVPEKFFVRDAETCQARCPGTAVALFVHRPGEDSEEMISYPYEVPYTDLRTAYVYRRTASMRPRTCGCLPPIEDFAFVTSEGEIPIPTPRPSLEETSSVNPTSEADASESADEDSVGVSQSDTDEMQRISAAPVPALDEKKDIRVVGPRFLPDPSEEIDLIGPGRPLGL